MRGPNDAGADMIIHCFVSIAGIKNQHVADMIEESIVPVWLGHGLCPSHYTCSCGTAGPDDAQMRNPYCVPGPMAPKAKGSKLPRGKAATSRMSQDERRARQKELRDANLEHTNAMARVRPKLFLFFFLHAHRVGSFRWPGGLGHLLCHVASSRRHRDKPLGHP